MAFSEKLKEEVKKKAFFRCVICQNVFVQVHHIIPQEEGGPDTIDNAAPLCANCHDLYGGNPSKRKQIRMMRDHWYEVVERMTHSDLEKFQPAQVNPDGVNALKDKMIAIYHVVLAQEDFVTAARMLYGLVYKAQQESPDQPRILYLDIEGHRNRKGGFDEDMLELQKEFLLGFLMTYLTEVHTPLIAVRNNKLQINELHEDLVIKENEL